jgi:hypothetical protein
MIVCFQATPSAAVPSTAPFGPAQTVNTAPPSTLHCGGTVELHTVPATISDGPGNYVSEMQCTWVLAVDGPVEMIFSTLDLEARSIMQCHASAESTAVYASIACFAHKHAQQHVLSHAQEINPPRLAMILFVCTLAHNALGLKSHLTPEALLLRH